MSATTTSSSINPTDTSAPNGGGGGGNSSAGAATYYGAIALAIAVMLGVSITSRVLYIRRTRRNLLRDRMELTRRGEEGGLPTYHETTSPHSLSYLTSPLSSLHASRLARSSQVPPSHPSYAPPASPRDRANRVYHPNDSLAPPAYLPPPPKYEGEEEDREAEQGGAGQAVDATEIEVVAGTGASGSASGSGSGSGSGSPVETTNQTSEVEPSTVTVPVNEEDVGEIALQPSIPIERRQSRDA